MDNMAQAKENKDRLQPYLSSAAAWALAGGTSVGSVEKQIQAVREALNSL